MNAEMLFEAIGEIREEYILEAEAVQAKPRRRPLVRLVAACLALLLVALPVSAEVRTGYVSNLLAPLYGGAQTELVDSVGIPIGASVTVGEYTLTADAVIGDRYHIAVVLSLCRTDGQPMPEGIEFDQWEEGRRGGTGGGWLSQKLNEDRTKLQITMQWTGTGQLFWLRRNMTVSFRDLVIDNDEPEEDTLVQEGLWELTFLARYEDTTVKVPVKNLTVQGAEGNVYEINKVLLSAIGIHIDMNGPNPHVDDSINGPLWPDFVVSLVLADDSRILLEDCNIGGSGSSGKPTFKVRYGAMFDTPIPLEEVKALIICGTTVPVDVK